MNAIPNLAGVATQDLVEQISGGGFKASYINWARTLHLLHQHAPGWLPELVDGPDGDVVHRAPAGAYLLIRFRHAEGGVTPSVPQAIMDARNHAIPYDKITARDVTDTHRRGACMAAALTFGLAYELWAKMPLETGYAPTDEAPETPAPIVAHPASGVKETISDERLDDIDRYAIRMVEYWESSDVPGGYEYLNSLGLTTEERVHLNSQLDSKFRAALKKHHYAIQAEKKEAA